MYPWLDDHQKLSQEHVAFQQNNQLKLSSKQRGKLTVNMHFNLGIKYKWGTKSLLHQLSRKTSSFQMLEVFWKKSILKKSKCLLEFLPFIVNTAVLKTATCIGGKSVCQAENNVTSNSPIKTFTSVISSIYDWLLVATRYWRPIRNALVVQTMPRT